MPRGDTRHSGDDEPAGVSTAGVRSPDSVTAHAAGGGSPWNPTHSGSRPGHARSLTATSSALVSGVGGGGDQPRSRPNGKEMVAAATQAATGSRTRRILDVPVISMALLTVAAH